MNKNNIYLYGASGHGKVVLDIITCFGNHVLGFFDDDSSIKNFMGYKVLSFNYKHLSKSKVIISIGNNSVRKKIAKQFDHNDFTTAIHPSSTIDKTVKINTGTVIMAKAVINSSTIIGEHCIINTAASVDHDCILENYVHISPNATLCGNVEVGELTHIGAGSVILPGVKIGKNVIIGAGSVVVTNVNDGETLVGNPAERLKKE